MYRSGKSPTQLQKRKHADSGSILRDTKTVAPVESAKLKQETRVKRLPVSSAGHVYSSSKSMMLHVSMEAKMNWRSKANHTILCTTCQGSSTQHVSTKDAQPFAKTSAPTIFLGKAVAIWKRRFLSAMFCRMRG